MMPNRTELAELLLDLRTASKGGNALDVKMQLAFFKPDEVCTSLRANAAGTKVIATYRDSSGKVTHGTAWSDDWTTKVDRALAQFKTYFPDFSIEMIPEMRGITREQFARVVVSRPGMPMVMVRAATLPLAICAAMVQVLIKIDLSEATS